MTSRVVDFAYCGDGPSPRQRLAEAVAQALPGARPSVGEWRGDPRDGYEREFASRWQEAGVTADVRLGFESSRDGAHPDPEIDRFRTPRLELTGNDARALDALQARFATLLEAVGYLPA